MANTKVTSNVISDDIALGGNPTTTTQSAGNNTTRIATTAFVKAAIDATIDSAPGALDTLNELAAAIGDDANFSTTITNSIATKLPLAGGTMTGNLTLNGADIVKSGSADLTIDVGGRIDLSADDNGEIRLFDGSSMYAQFKDDSDRLKIQSLISDADMMFVGNDNGSEVTALTLDMSDAGTATFNHDVKLGDDSELVLGDGTDLKFYHSGSVNYIKTNSDLPLKIWDAGGAGILEMTPNGKVGIFHNGSEKIYTTSTGAVIAHNSDTDYSSTGEPAGILTLYNSNGSDGGGVNNYSSLEFNTGDGATSQGFINYVRTADNQGSFAFSQRTGSSSYAESIRIDNSGHLLVGKTSGTSGNKVETDGRISAGAGSNSQPTFNCEGDTNTGINLPETDRIQLITGGTERVRIAADGKVGLGETDPNEPLTIRSSAENVDTVLIEIGNDLHASNTKDAWIKYVGGAAQTDHSWATGILSNSYRVVQLGARGTAPSSGTETMRITDGGLMCVGDTTGYPGGHDAVSRLQLTGGGSVLGIRQSQVTDSSHRVVAVFTDAGGTYRGRITVNNSSCSFTAASDYRLKENIETLPNGLDRLKQLKPVKFKWKEHDYTSEGFIAHEVQEIYPDAVVGAKDDAVMQSMDYGKITPLLVKAIQEQQTIIDDLKSRIKTLEDA